MSSKFPKGRKASAKPVAPATATLPPAGDMPPAKVLSGAFKAALGGVPQMPHSGSKIRNGAGAIPRRLAEEAGMRPVKNTRHGAAAAPRKGHR